MYLLGTTDQQPLLRLCSIYKKQQAVRGGRGGEGGTGRTHLHVSPFEDGSEH